MRRLLRPLCVWMCFALASEVGAAAVSPTLPGDCNLDWAIDAVDHAGLQACLVGPDGYAAPDCGCYDLDSDGDVDLRDFAEIQDTFTAPQLLSYQIQADIDDGTEVDGLTWHTDGYLGTGLNWMGALDAESYDIGLRFQVPGLCQGETLAYARLVIPASDAGYVDSVAALRILGVDDDGVTEFSFGPPSHLPKTEARADWDLRLNWPDHAGASDCFPLRRYTPNLAPIINEIIARPDWGQDRVDKTLALVIENNGSADGNCLTVQDYRINAGDCAGVVIAPVLELYRTVNSTFIGREMLGRPTDHSVTLNACSLLPLEACVEFGTEPGIYDAGTPLSYYPGGTPIEIVLDELTPDTRYYYRMKYRPQGQSSFRTGTERTFHTQRAAGAAFTFTVQSDSHITPSMFQPPGESSCALYRQTLRNALGDQPDFHIDLGDTFFCGSKGGRDVLDFIEATERHLLQRPFLDLVCHSAPFFFAIGNHEDEVGWGLDGTPDNVSIWATNARKRIYPLPAPDDFYTGNTQDVDFVGLREDYYAWQWGDALFVILDPFWYTMTQPHEEEDGARGSGDNWDWTLGRDQYNWFVATLENSSAKYKFVFSHHVTGGVTTYGRGGVEAASHALGGLGSFEWGGEDVSGDYTFDAYRPGWGNPIHKVMSENEVSIFFHGHDHVFVKQDLDGIVYQECPQPSDPAYSEGMYVDGLYLSGDKVNNSGHLRVQVGPEDVKVDYIRAYLPGDGDNGEIAYSYTVLPPDP